MPRYIERPELEPIEARIHHSLDGVEAKYSSTFLNIFTGQRALDGYGVGLSISVHPGGSIDYHLRRKRPKDFDGYHEAWDYYWGGDRVPSALHTRIQDSRIFMSSHHPYDTIEQRQLDKDDIRLLNLYIDQFEIIQEQNNSVPENKV